MAFRHVFRVHTPRLIFQPGSKRLNLVPHTVLMNRTFTITCARQITNILSIVWRTWAETLPLPANHPFRDIISPRLFKIRHHWPHRRHQAFRLPRTWTIIVSDSLIIQPHIPAQLVGSVSLFRRIQHSISAAPPSYLEDRNYAPTIDTIYASLRCLTCENANGGGIHHQNSDIVPRYFGRRVCMS